MRYLPIIILVLCSSPVFSQQDSIASGVYSFNKAATTKTKDGERRSILRGSSLDLANLSIHTSTLAPGATNHPLVAYDDREELIVIKEGSVTVMLNDSSKVLDAGSVILIEPGDKQSFKNEGSTVATYFVLTFRSRLPVDMARGRKAGGSISKRWSDLQVIKTDKGESRPMFIKPSGMFAKFDIHATALNPGFASHPPHTHRNEEIILMIKGNAESLINGKPFPVEAGDIVFVNANAPHNITNTGKVQCGYFAIQWTD